MERWRPAARPDARVGTGAAGSSGAYVALEAVTGLFREKGNVCADARSDMTKEHLLSA